MPTKKSFVILVMLLFLSACMSTHPLPQPKRVIEPSEVNGSIKTVDWDIAVLRYRYEGQGLNYLKAGVLPVFIVFKNKSKKQPYILRSEIHGISPTMGEYLAYSPDETVRLVFASESFKQTSRNVLRSGTLGAVVGAGLGALFAALGGNNVVKGAAIGGAIGGGAFSLSKVPEAEQRLRNVIAQEVRTYAWKEDPIPPLMTQMGYVYFPAQKNIQKVLLTVRTNSTIDTYQLPILSSY